MGRVSVIRPDASSIPDGPGAYLFRDELLEQLTGHGHRPYAIEYAGTLFQPGQRGHLILAVCLSSVESGQFLAEPV